MSDTASASRAYTGLWNVLGGVSPRITSRITPPPTAVVSPRMNTPKMSMPFFTPSTAPETAKAAVPISSSTKMSAPKDPTPGF